MLKNLFISTLVSVVYCNSLLAAVSLVSVEINGPASVDENTQTPYTCTAHYSDSSTADVTAFADWSIPGAANTGRWNYDLWDAKAESEARDIPMLYVWGSATCSYCTKLDGYMDRPVFQQWMQSRQLVMAYVKSTNIDTTAEKTFAKYGQNGTLHEYPFVAVYWQSKNSEPWNFTGRYSGGNEEQQFINEIESYISEYVSGPANSAAMQNNQLMAYSVPSNTVVTISVLYSGLTDTKQVTIVDVPAPRLISGESFETGFGVWSHSAGNDIDWTRKSGPTLSYGTGPSGASDGNYYIYTEASGNYPAKTAAIEAVFNVSSAIDPILKFDYHMYGSAMGSLYVDVYNGTAWQTAVWSITGQQQGSSSAAWTEAEVDLSAFTGNVTVRLRGVTDSGSTSDMAVDNVRFMDKSGLAPLAYSDWLDQESVPLNQRGETDTPASDGIPNLLKYACGLPAMTSASSADLLDIVPDAVGDVFAVRYYRAKTATDVILKPVWASVLTGPWQTSGITEVKVGEDGTREEWQGSVPLGSTGFIRLRATSVE